MKPKVSGIRIQRKDGSTLFAGAVNELPIREDYMISSSYALFKDKDPCVIHRTYIAKKLYFEVHEKIRGFKKNGRQQIDSCEITEFSQCINLDMENAEILID